MHKSRVLDLLPDDEPAAEGATEETTDAQSPWGNGSSDDREGVLRVLVDVVGLQPQVFAVRGAEVVRLVGARVLAHGRAETAVAHTALLLLALAAPCALAPCDHRGLLGV